MDRGLRPLLITTFLLGVLAGVALLATELGTAEEGPVKVIGSPLVTSNREALSFCVDAASGASVSSPLMQQVQQTLESLAADLAGPFGTSETVLTEGCPPPTGLTEQPVLRKDRGGKIVLIPSEHSVFIFVVPEDAFQRAFGDAPYGVSAEELFCSSEHVCGEVTSGLYVTSSVSAEALREGLLEGLGLLLPRDIRLRPAPPIPDEPINP